MAQLLGGFSKVHLISDLTGEEHSGFREVMKFPAVISAMEDLKPVEYQRQVVAGDLYKVKLVEPSTNRFYEMIITHDPYNSKLNERPNPVVRPITSLASEPPSSEI